VLLEDIVEIACETGIVTKFKAEITPEICYGMINLEWPPVYSALLAKFTVPKDICGFLQACP
jgi:hypothetical protein